MQADLVVYSVEERSEGRDLNEDGDTGDHALHFYDLTAGVTTNLRLGGNYLRFAGHVDLPRNWLALAVSESQQGEDLNGDGDADDSVVHTHTVSSGTTANLGLARGNGRSELSGKWLAFVVRESDQGEDLNSDGDVIDEVVHVHDLEAGKTRNLGLAGRVNAISAGRLVFSVNEYARASGEGRDLNGDGDVRDKVVHVHDLETDTTTNLRLGTGWAAVIGKWVVIRGSVLHVHDLESGRTANLGLATRCTFGGFGPKISGRGVVLTVGEGIQGRQDLNGDGDARDCVLYVHDLETGTTANLGLAVFRQSSDLVAVSDSWLVFAASESGQGEDLNGDGDTGDQVLYVHDFESARTTNLRLGATWGIDIVADAWVVLHVWEGFRREDLNSDGDAGDVVLHIHELRTGMTRNLGISPTTNSRRSSGDSYAFTAYESAAGEDLNDDGDFDDEIVFVHHFASGTTRNLGLAGDPKTVAGNWLVFGVREVAQGGSDLNDDGDARDEVLYLHDLDSDATRNLGFAQPRAIAVSGNWLLFSSREQGQDLDGDDEADDREVLRVADLSMLKAKPRFRRGDCNDDGEVGISDAMSTLGSLFLGAGDAGCDDACDSNDDGAVDVSDAINTLGVIFLGEGTIPLPGMNECGVDPTGEQPQELGCEGYKSCPEG